MYKDAAPLGKQIATDFGNSVYSLGFSANSGSRGSKGAENEDIPTQADSLENRVISASSRAVVFVTGREFSSDPEVSAVLNHQFHRAQWQKFFDGIVVFKSERPPNRSNK